MDTDATTAGDMARKTVKRRYRSEMHRRQRSKNLTMFAVLVGLVVLFYFVALVRMGGG